MIFVLRSGTTPQERAHFLAELERRGARAVEVSEGGVTAYAAQGGAGVAGLQAHPAVERVVMLAPPYKLAARGASVDDRVVRVGNVPIGGEHFAALAGPCAVESEAQLRAAARAACEAGAAILRGGAFKPRTSPYSFQGLGAEALTWLRQVADELDMAVCTEVLDTRDVELVSRHADLLQIGARNSQNTPLLVEAGRTKKPILLKRGMAQTLQELLLSAEYALDAGAAGVILCERGVRTFDRETRHLLDVAAVPALQRLTNLPVVVDPSHAAGRSELVVPLAKAAVAAGANGLLVEVHPEPESAKSDGRQALRPAEFAALMERVERLLELEGKVLSTPTPR